MAFRAILPFLLTLSMVSAASAQWGQSSGDGCFPMADCDKGTCGAGICTSDPYGVDSCLEIGRVHCAFDAATSCPDGFSSYLLGNEESPDSICVPEDWQFCSPPGVITHMELQNCLGVSGDWYNGDCDGNGRANVDGDVCGAGAIPPPRDVGVPDVGVPDVGVPDVGVPDAGVPDVGAPDAPDAGARDAGKMDAARPAPPGLMFTGGGGCATSPNPPAEPLWLLVVLVGLTLRRRL